MPETPKTTHDDKNSTVIDNNNYGYDYTLPASTLVTNKYQDVWLDEVSGSESEKECNSENESDTPSEYNYRDNVSDFNIPDLELPPPTIIQKPVLKRTVAGENIFTNDFIETHANQNESDQETQYDSDGDVIMQDVE